MAVVKSRLALCLQVGILLLGAVRFGGRCFLFLFLFLLLFFLSRLCRLSPVGGRDPFFVLCTLEGGRIQHHHTYIRGISFGEFVAFTSVEAFFVYVFSILRMHECIVYLKHILLNSLINPATHLNAMDFFGSPRVSPSTNKLQ